MISHIYFTSMHFYLCLTTFLWYYTTHMNIRQICLRHKIACSLYFPTSHQQMISLDEQCTHRNRGTRGQQLKSNLQRVWERQINIKMEEKALEEKKKESAEIWQWWKHHIGALQKFCYIVAAAWCSYNKMKPWKTGENPSCESPDTRGLPSQSLVTWPR